jgi:hypothetical protein
VNTPRLFSVGECPVCFDSGAITVLRAVGTDTLVFFCPLCGLAWPTPPPPDRLDEIIALNALAPNGVSLPAREELETVGLPLTEASSWLPFLDGILRVDPLRK